MKWIDKIHTMTSDELTDLVTEDFDHTAVCNICYYYHEGKCCDMCQMGIKAFLESEVPKNIDLGFWNKDGKYIEDILQTE